MYYNQKQNALKQVESRMVWLQKQMKKAIKLKDVKSFTLHSNSHDLCVELRNELID